MDQYELLFLRIIAGLTIFGLIIAIILSLKNKQV